MERSLVFALLEKGTLAEPVVEGNANLGQVIPDQGDHFLTSNVADLLQRLFPVHAQEPGPLRGGDLFSEIGYVLTDVTVGGHLGELLHGFQVAGVNGGIEGVHLVARVVYIVFLRDLVTGGFQYVSQGATQHSAAGMSHMDGARWIDADVLHHHGFLLTQIDVAILHPGPPDLLHLLLHPSVSEVKVDEPRGGRRDLFHLFAQGNVLHQ